MTQPGPPPQVPITNGFVRSMAHVRLEIAGLEFTGGFKAIKRSRKRSRAYLLRVKWLKNSPKRASNRS